MQTIQVPDVTDSNDNIGVTITTDNTSTVSLSLLGMDESDDTFDVKSGALTGIATAANNGNVTFFIKGLEHGTSTLTFNADTDTSTVKQLVNVIGIEAEIDIEDEPFGEVPLVLKFTDISEDVNEVDGITNKEQKWIFDEDSGIVIEEGGDANAEEITLQFDEEGLHIVTLEITADIAGIGLVTDRTSTAVCIFPAVDEVEEVLDCEELEIGEESGVSISGVVWFEDEVGARQPVTGAVVTLIGNEKTYIAITGLNGIYRFDRFDRFDRDIPPGNYTTFACLLGVCAEGTDSTDAVINEFFLCDGDSINIDFVLKKQTI